MAGSQRPTKTSSPSSSHVSRARVDPKRRYGFANAVANGAMTRRVGVMSESELCKIRHLLTADEDSYNAYRRHVDEQRAEACKARIADWSDTVQAKQETFLRQREQEKEEAERRKAMLIELSKEHQEEERRQKRAHMTMKLLQDDPRSHHVRSLILLDEAIKDRDAQLAVKAQIKQLEEEQRKKEQEVLMSGAHDDTVKEQEEKYNRIAREVDLKNEHLKQMMFQIAERKKLRAMDKAEALEAKRAAEEEEEDNLEELMELRKKAAEVNKYNRSVAKPPKSKHDRLLERVKQEEIEEECPKQGQVLEELKKRMKERIEKKRQNFERAKELSHKAFEEEHRAVQHIARTQDHFEKECIDMVGRMAAADDARKQQLLEERRRRAEELQRRGMGEVEKLPENVQRAATHRAGFMNEEEAHAYQLEMRRHPERVRMEQRLEAERLRKEAELLQHIHKLQMEERRENERREMASELEGLRMMEEATKEDEERYRTYVESQLPKDMNPYLRQKALELRV